MRGTFRSVCLTATALAFAFSHAAGGRQAVSNAVYTLVPAPHGVQLKTPDGRAVFEYMTKKPGDAGLTSPESTTASISERDGVFVM